MLKLLTLWCQLQDMFQLIVMLQGIEKVVIQLKDTPSKVWGIGSKLFLSKVPLEVLQNWVLIQLIVALHAWEKVQGQIKEICQLIEPCLLGTRECCYQCHFKLQTKYFIMWEHISEQNLSVRTTLNQTFKLAIGAKFVTVGLFHNLKFSPIPNITRRGIVVKIAQFDWFC